MTDEVTLARAIHDYYAEADEYVDAWVLVTHRLSTDLESQNTTAVGVIVKPDQSWVMTRGLLEVARDNESSTGYVQEDDDD